MGGSKSLKTPLRNIKMTPKVLYQIVLHVLQSKVTNALTSIDIPKRQHARYLMSESENAP